MLKRLAQLCGHELNHAPETSFRVLGIDLGTTNSTLAQMIWDASSGTLSDTECIPLDQETIEGTKTSVLFPSVVATYDNRTWIGAGAKKLRASRVGVELRENVSYFAETKNDMGIRRTYKAPPGYGSARAIASHVLRALAQGAEDASPAPIKKTVVTVPASFQVAQRQDTMDAAQRANIQVESGGLLDEPIAAFLDYIFHTATQSITDLAIGQTRNLLVLDFGGGTCDVAIFRIAKKPKGALSVMPVSVSRYHRLGGGDIDRAIVTEVLLRQFVKEQNLGELMFEEKQLVVIPTLLPLAESLKEKMSMEIARLKRLGRFEAMKSELRQSLPGTYPIYLPGRTLSITSPCISEEQFDTVLRPFLDLDLLQPREDEYRMSCSIFAPITDALDRADLSEDDIGFCLLAGGSSLIPQVQEAVGAFFKKAELLTFASNDDTQTAIAKGAALHAMATALFGHGIVESVCHDDVSFQTLSGPVTLVPRGESLPYPKEGFARNEKFRSPESRIDGHLPVRVALVAGREYRPLFSTMWNIPAPIREGERLWLEYRFDENQCFELRMGRDGEDVPQCAVQIENPLTHVVNPNKVRAQIEELEEKYRENGVAEEDVPEHLERIGDLYRNLGQREKAMAYFRWTLRRLPQPSVFLLNKMAACAREQQNRTSAEKLFEEAARVSNWSGTYFNWALAKETWGDVDAALNLVKRASELESDPAYLVLQARLERRLGHAAECDRLLTEAISGFGKPADLTDWSLFWMSTASGMAGLTDLKSEIERILRNRRLQREGAPSIGLTPAYDDGLEKTNH